MQSSPNLAVHYRDIVREYDVLAENQAASPFDTVVEGEIAVPFVGQSVVIGAENVKHRSDITWGTAQLEAVADSERLTVVIEKIRDRFGRIGAYGLAFSQIPSFKTDVFPSSDTPDVFDSFMLELTPAGQGGIAGLSGDELHQPKHNHLLYTKLMAIACVRGMRRLSQYACRQQYEDADVRS